MNLQAVVNFVLSASSFYLSLQLASHVVPRFNSNRIQLSLPMHKAAMDGDNKALETAILDNSGSVNCLDQHHYTPLLIAIKHRKIGAIELLIANGADLELGDATGLHCCAAASNIEAAMLLIDTGADLDAVSHIGNLTPLHFAAMNEDKPMVNLLVAEGANIEARNVEGNTPLQLSDDSSLFK
eukprot:GILI01025081.1.p1 GENE.GILI01025081.1~~GILI01025081.1.p1  ORF type:complete len:183 (+),score=21.42 GILI01025081.1:244-792(+)